MKHNKKRNTALLYEFLARHAAECVVEGNETHARAAIKLLKKHFREGTQLHNEFRLFRALTAAFVSDRTTAERIVETSRIAARRYDRQKLDHEKSLLIRGINHTFKDDAFYNKRIEEFKLYATVQTLLNEWREDVPSDVVQVALYEADLIEHLLTPKQKNILDESKADVDDLVVNLMLKKVDSRYKGVLNDEQVTLLNTYVYSMKNDDESRVRETIEKLRLETLEAIDAYAQQQKDESIISRLNEARALVSQDVKEINDQTFARYLRIARLKQEILGS